MFNKLLSEHYFATILAFVIDFDFLGFLCILGSEDCPYLHLYNGRSWIVTCEPMTMYGLALIMKPKRLMSAPNKHMFACSVYLFLSLTKVVLYWVIAAPAITNISVNA